MVPIIGPGGVKAIASGLALAHESWIVEIRLGDDKGRTPQLSPKLLHFDRELFQHVHWALVHDRVHGVEPQPVHVIVANPHQRVVDDEAPHLVAAGAVEVDRGSPVGVMTVAEVRSELRKEVAGRPQVVVDHVHHDSKPCCVARIDQPFEPQRSTVRVMRGEQIEAPS